ncbi:hypothetical protein LTR78_007747 [Recurvomyces mirabilis]|uniref:Uncharacterized protein n=1 Tax=Recurvomyces mirabilis TaxID=574656 RepID=A0AAE0TU43_9PEZI|nr:hypothetical protein LTR78_007747 [Recurvomyces mirabilis]KAK5151635.1 hypothetical protein LTS14_009122 [Recurvomyces mirabilis]
MAFEFDSTLQWARTYLPPITVTVFYFLYVNREQIATHHALEAGETLCCIFAAVKLLLGWTPNFGGVLDFLFISIFLSIHILQQYGRCGVAAQSSGIVSKRKTLTSSRRLPTSPTYREDDPSAPRCAANCEGIGAVSYQ